MLCYEIGLQVGLRIIMYITGSHHQALLTSLVKSSLQFDHRPPPCPGSPPPDMARNVTIRNIHQYLGSQLQSALARKYIQVLTFGKTSSRPAPEAPRPAWERSACSAPELARLGSGPNQRPGPAYRMAHHSQPFDPMTKKRGRSHPVARDGGAALRSSKPRHPGSRVHCRPIAWTLKAYS